MTKIIVLNITVDTTFTVEVATELLSHADVLKT